MQALCKRETNSLSYLNETNSLPANTASAVFAGFETTATSASYLIWCMAKHVECQSALRASVQKHGMQSEYLDMFIKEVMRMFPALPNFVIRTPNADTQVGGVRVKRGTPVYMSVQAVHYDSRLWPEPHLFKPERFAQG